MTNQLEALIAEMKAAAEKAKQANELYLENKITLSECVIETKDYLDYSDNPNNVLALIAALEQAQQYAKDRDAENQDLMLTVGRLRVEREGLDTIKAAAEKLVRCKGRYHSEQNYRALAALFGVITPDLPPLDGEVSQLSVKLPEPLMPAQNASGELFMTPDNVEQGGYLNRDAVIRSLRRSGITVQGDE